MTITAITEATRERLLKVLASHEVYRILIDAGHPDIAKKNAVEGRSHLLKHWNDDVRDRVMKIIKENIEETP